MGAVQARPSGAANWELKTFSPPCNICSSSECVDGATEVGPGKGRADTNIDEVIKQRADTYSCIQIDMGPVVGTQEHEGTV